MWDNNPHYSRSSDYRAKFIKEKPGVHGLYMCSYCGRIVDGKHMEVDHIIPINLAQRKRIYQWMLKGESVNSKANLTSSCRKCNRKKSNTGGLWIFWGRVGPMLQPILWIMFIPAIAWYIWWFWTSIPHSFFI